MTEVNTTKKATKQELLEPASQVKAFVDEVLKPLKEGLERSIRLLQKLFRIPIVKRRTTSSARLWS
jgi:hypothetical protein